MSLDSSSRYFTLCVLAVVLATVVAQEFNLEDNVKELIARKKNLEFMRQLVDDMNNQLTRLHKRSCYFRLPGMDCDYGDLAGDSRDRGAWGDEEAPGKKRRRSSSRSDCYKIGNPEGCLGKEIDENTKDETHWGNPDGPGKK